MKKEIYITINHLEDFCGLSNIKVDDVLVLKKDHDNYYDDEAIAIYNLNDIKVGYVANSVRTVARGCQSSGRIYDQFDETIQCKVMFIINDSIIAKLI